jgi:hypothetical protein
MTTAMKMFLLSTRLRQACREWQFIERSGGRDAAAKWASDTARLVQEASDLLEQGACELSAVLHLLRSRDHK